MNGCKNPECPTTTLPGDSYCDNCAPSDRGGWERGWFRTAFAYACCGHSHCLSRGEVAFFTGILGEVFCAAHASDAECPSTLRSSRQPPVGEPADTKPTNPKDAIGSDKLPLHLWPETATAMGCIGLLDGALKYGRGNYRAIGVKATIYTDACKRHINAWLEGEECAPDSGIPHLAHALACLAILVDAEAAGQLTDDRQFPGGYHELVEQLTPHVARLRALHAGKTPRHYTIADDADELLAPRSP